MIRHHQFEQRRAGAQNFFGIGGDLHARFNGANAGGRENPRASVHNAEPADADGRLILQMAECGDVDAVHARGVKYARTARHADGLAVNRDVNQARRCCGARHIRGEYQRVGLRRRGQRE